MSEPATEGEFLKCDAPGCDHFEMTPVTIAVVDKPCPKCGANLCTKEDFLHHRTFVAATDAARELALRANPNAPLTLVAHNIHNGELRRVANPVFGVNPFPNEK